MNMRQKCLQDYPSKRHCIDLKFKIEGLKFRIHFTMDYFQINKKFTPQKGDLLISEPYLPDPNFERTAILICEHDENGTFGFVLNKLTEYVFDEVMKIEGDFKESIFLGGPVQQDTLHFIHRVPELFDNKKEIIDGIYWGGEFERLLSLINTKEIDSNDFRFFIGYSGWEAGQLDEELKAKSWIVYQNTNTELIFDTPHDNIWKQILSEMGGKFKMFSNYPIDPNLN